MNVGMDPSVSMVSKSTSESTSALGQSTQPKNILSATLDPLYDIITQNVAIPQIIYYVFLLEMFVQLMFTSLWANHTILWESNPISHDFVDYLQCIASFSGRHQNDNNMLISFVIYTVIFIIIFGVLAGQLIAFRKSRRFNKASLYPTRVILELFTLVLMTPISIFTANMFVELVVKQNTNAMIAAFFVISLLEYIATSVLYYYTTSLIGASAYFSLSPFCAFNYRPFTKLLTMSPLFLLLSNCFEFFPEWVEDVLIIIHLIFMIFFIAEMVRRPLVSTFSNVLFMTIGVASIGNDLTRFISIFFKNPNGLFASIAFFVFIVLGAIFSSVFYQVQKNILTKNLTFPVEEGNIDTMPTDSERLERLMSLKLDRSESKAVFYLDFIVANHVVQFLDFFLIKFIIQYHHNIRTLSHCIRIIACFPPESRNLNILFNEAVKRRDMKFTHRFLFFQIQKIKLLRQSSSSVAAGERLKDLKQKTKELETSVKSFWTRNNTSIGYLLSVSNELQRTRALWDEALTDFPNSIPYSEECSHFMIECASDFTGAIKNKHRADLIESGRNFNIDMCFRQFVRNFPEYLKSKIIDLKGNFISQARNKKGTQTSSNSGNNNMASSASSSFSELDVAVEEGIGRTLISHAKIRLALQRATESRKANKYLYLVAICLILLILSLTCFLFIFIYFDSYFDKRLESSERIEKINQARMYLYCCAVMISYQWGNATGAVDIDTIINQIAIDDNETPSVQSFMKIDTWQNRATLYNIKSQEQYSNFLDDVSEQSKLGVNMYQYTEAIFEETTSIAFTANGIVYEPQQYNLKTVIMYCFMTSTLLIGVTSQADYDTWYLKSRPFGNLICSLQLFPPSFDSMRDTLTEMSTFEAETAKNLLQILMIIFPVAYGVICVASFMIISVLFKKELDYFISLLLKLPPDVKQAAFLSLRKTAIDDDTNTNNGIGGGSGGIGAADAATSGGDGSSGAVVPLTLLIIGTIFYAINALLMLFQIRNVDSYNTKYRYLNLWTADSRIRKSYVMQLLLWINQAIVFKNPKVINSNFSKIEYWKDLILKDFNSLDAATKSMLEDNADYPSGSGVDSFIDEWTLQKTCEPNETRSSFHELYRCGSGQNLITFFLNTIDEILIQLDTYNGIITGEIPSQILHLANCHLIPTLLQIDERWAAIGDKFRTDYSLSHILFFIAELLCAIISAVIGFFLIRSLNSSYKVNLILLRRVSPVAIVASADLVNYLLDKSTSTASSEMSTAQGIIHNSSDAVLCLGTNGVVDILNPAVSKTFGFTPEQLLGQPIAMIFDEGSRTQIEQQMELMRNHQSATTYEDHTTCVSDDDSKIPCSITILAMLDEDNEVKSFVMILRDESVLIQQQKQAEEAKKQSESLLYQILPRNIVIRLNQGEKDISFTVPSATIMFIDIVKFSEYAASLTPQEIMGNLSLIFAGFDETILKFELLTKIKLIGDVYMCAGGLFTPDEQPVSHADQMTKFGLECLQILEDTNVKLNAVLNVRIGINTGGPLIAGVLGTDKPTFDIIGDPINIASRLQSTDVPGRIQISQTTYDLINGMDFQIESRGEVFLKGKGKQQAYLVSASRPFVINISGVDGGSSIDRDSALNLPVLKTE